jgi:voltage-gated potassium channel
MTPRSAPSDRNLPAATSDPQLQRQRRGLLRSVSALLDGPMTMLAFVWVGLMIVEFTGGMSPLLEWLNFSIWGLFILHFLLEFWIAPNKVRYLRHNWLTALALLLPALRVLRVVRAFRVLRLAKVGRGVRLVRWLTSLNRGMKATRSTLEQRGLWYVTMLTVLVNFAGAAGIFLFENPAALKEAGLTLDHSTTGIRSYGEAVWWTAMMVTTMGSDYFPKTSEGRLIAWLLALYGFAIFGYITATVASFIIQVDEPQKTAAARTTQLQAISLQLAELRAQYERTSQQLARLERRLDRPTEP